MAGELVSLVLFPRYTTLLGATTFTTLALDATDYQSAIVNVWRAPLIGTAGSITVSFEESTDQDTWTTCANGTGGDPGPNTEVQYKPSIAKRWFRAKVVLGGTDPGATFWALGFLELRLR